MFLDFLCDFICNFLCVTLPCTYINYNFNVYVLTRTKDKVGLRYKPSYTFHANLFFFTLRSNENDTTLLTFS